MLDWGWNKLTRELRNAIKQEQLMQLILMQLVWMYFTFFSLGGWQFKAIEGWESGSKKSLICVIQTYF